MFFRRLSLTDRGSEMIFLLTFLYSSLPICIHGLNYIFLYDSMHPSLQPAILQSTTHPNCSPFPFIQSSRDGLYFRVLAFFALCSYRLFLLSPVITWIYAVYYSVPSAPLHSCASQSHHLSLRVCEFLSICSITLSAGKRMKLTSFLVSSASMFFRQTLSLSCLVFSIFNKNPLFAIHVSSDLIILFITVSVAVNSRTVITSCCGLSLSQSFLPPSVLTPHPTHFQHSFGLSLLFTSFFYFAWSRYSCNRLMWIGTWSLLPPSSTRSQLAPSMLVTVQGPIHLRFNAAL